MLLSTLAGDPRVWLGLAYFGGVGTGPDVGGGGGGRAEVGVALGRNPERSLGILAFAREGVATPEFRTLGTVNVLLRFPAGHGLFVVGGFAHHHETEFADFLADPGTTALATNPAIHHRTGFEVGAGYDLGNQWPDNGIASRIRLFASASAVVLPNSVGPPVYVMADLGFRFGVDRLRRE